MSGLEGMTSAGHAEPVRFAVRRPPEIRMPTVSVRATGGASPA